SRIQLRLPEERPDARLPPEPHLLRRDHAIHARPRHEADRAVVSVAAHVSAVHPYQRAQRDALETQDRVGAGGTRRRHVGTDTDRAREEQPDRHPHPHPSPHGRTVPLGAAVYESSHIFPPGRPTTRSCGKSHRIEFRAARTVYKAISKHDAGTPSIRKYSIRTTALCAIAH